MSFQNPVFIPGPTNIPEKIRQACSMELVLACKILQLLQAFLSQQLSVVLQTKFNFNIWSITHSIYTYHKCN